jgi:hypothetical protein
MQSKRQTLREKGTQSHGTLRVSRAAEAERPFSARFAAPGLSERKGKRSARTPRARNRVPGATRHPRRAIQPCPDRCRRRHRRSLRRLRHQRPVGAPGKCGRGRRPDHVLDSGRNRLGRRRRAACAAGWGVGHQRHRPRCADPRGNSEQPRHRHCGRLGATGGHSARGGHGPPFSRAPDTGHYRDQPHRAGPEASPRPHRAVADASAHDRFERRVSGRRRPDHCRHRAASVCAEDPLRRSRRTSLGAGSRKPCPTSRKSCALAHPVPEAPPVDERLAQWRLCTVRGEQRDRGQSGIGSAAARLGRFPGRTRTKQDP